MTSIELRRVLADETLQRVLGNIAENRAVIRSLEVMSDAALEDNLSRSDRLGMLALVGQGAQRDLAVVE